MPGSRPISFRLTARHGRYEVFEAFASGGIATVHLAKQINEGVTRLCAVKRLHDHHAKDRSFRAALLDEARLVASIQHPNVVAILDVCEEGGDVFLVMDYVDGLALDELMGHGPIDPVIACDIVGAALKGLHAAHELRGKDGEPLALVHRDVSPQNILVGADGVTRVIDFGLAYALGRSHATQSGIIKGKPSYMAPEQLRGERVTRTADVFAAGVTLWNALTGKELFSADTVDGTIYKVLSGPIPSPRVHVPALSPALESVVMRALSRSSPARFPNALAMAKALESAAGSAPYGAVGEWVEHVGGPALAPMRQRVRDVEVGAERPLSLARVRGDADAAPTLTEIAPPTVTPAGTVVVRSRVSAAAIVGAAVGASVVLGLVGVVSLARSTTTRPATEDAVAHPLPGASPSSSATSMAQEEAPGIVAPAASSARASDVRPAPPPPATNLERPSRAPTPTPRPASPPTKRKDAPCNDPLNPKCN